jgi:hypothetical protein
MSPTLRYLAIGDIFMTGPELPERASWPFQVVDHLRRGGMAVDDPEFVCEPTGTVAELTHALRAKLLPKDFDVVTIQAGAMDISGDGSEPEYALAFGDLLDEAILHARGDGWHVVVMPPPLFGRVDIETHLERFGRFTALQFQVLMSREYPHYVNIVDDSVTSWFSQEGHTPSGWPGAGDHAAWAERAAHAITHLLAHPAPPPPSAEELEQIERALRGVGEIATN